MEISRFSVIEHDGVIVGCAALYPFADERAAELACLAVALVNLMVTRVLGPKPLPRLDLDDGVPTDLRTLVVVPMQIGA